MIWFWFISLVVMTVWFLVDRHRFTRKILNEWDAGLKDIEKAKSDYASAKENYDKMLDSKWDLMLLEACQIDHDFLIQNHKQNLQLNVEFEKTKADFNYAFQNHQPLKAIVARLINLLQLEHVVTGRYALKNQKHLN